MYEQKWPVRFLPAIISHDKLLVERLEQWRAAGQHEADRVETKRSTRWVADDRFATTLW